MGKPTSVDDYIQTFPAEMQTILEKVRQAIAAELPDAEQTISYSIPTFKMNGQYLVYFAGWKDHISVYPIPPKGDKVFQKEIAPFRTGKGTLQFPLDKPIPYDLIRKIAQLHLEEKVL